MKYSVDVLMHYREMDGKVRHIGEFLTVEDAVAAAKRTIGEFLVRRFRQGMLPATLFTLYREFGEVPYIFRTEEDDTTNVPGFNHFEYAKSLCIEMCRTQDAEVAS